MSYFRHPKTTQERRASFDGYCRAKRNASNLPDAWDDISKKSGDRCWKNYRKTQYKVVDKFNHQKKDSSSYAKAMAKRDHFHFNHKPCHYRRIRCKYCIKNHIWDEADKYFERRRRRYLEKERLELQAFLKERGYDD